MRQKSADLERERERICGEIERVYRARFGVASKYSIILSGLDFNGKGPLSIILSNLTIHLPFKIYSFGPRRFVQNLSTSILIRKII